MTNICVQDALLAEAVRLANGKTKQETVHAALREYVLRRKQRRLLTVFGKLNWDPQYDYKHERR